MTGTTLKIRGASFTKVLFNIRLPSVTGLTHEYVYGNNDAQSIQNLAPVGGVSTVVGVPTYGPYHAVIKSTVASQGYNIGIPAVQQPEVTIIVVIQMVTNLAIPCMGGGNPLTGFFNGGAVYLCNANLGTANQPNVPYPTHGNYSIFVGTCPLAGIHRMFSWVAGARTITPALANGGPTRGATSTFVGTTISGGGSGTTNIAYVAIYNRILSDAEIDQTYLSLKNFYNGKIIIS